MKRPQPTAPQKFFGKYRGLVMNNVDPMQIGRVTLQVPDVLGEAPSSWALPCLPVAGPQAGIFAVPAVGASVWVEFEQGDPDYPIWVGGFWKSADDLPPAAQQAAPTDSGITLQTPHQNGITLSDLPGPGGGVILKSAGGASVIVNDTGIYLQNGKGATITLAGPEVSINTDALVII